MGSKGKVKVQKRRGKLVGSVNTTNLGSGAAAEVGAQPSRPSDWTKRAPSRISNKSADKPDKAPV